MIEKLRFLNTFCKQVSTSRLKNFRVIELFSKSISSELSKNSEKNSNVIRKKIQIRKISINQ